MNKLNKLKTILFLTFFLFIAVAASSIYAKKASNDLILSAIDSIDLLIKSKIPKASRDDFDVEIVRSDEISFFESRKLIVVKYGKHEDQKLSVALSSWQGPFVYHYANEAGPFTPLLSFMTIDILRSDDAQGNQQKYGTFSAACSFRLNCTISLLSNSITAKMILNLQQDDQSGERILEISPVFDKLVAKYMHHKKEIDANFVISQLNVKSDAYPLLEKIDINSVESSLKIAFGADPVVELNSLKMNVFSGLASIEGTIGLNGIPLDQGGPYSLTNASGKIGIDPSVVSSVYREFFRIDEDFKSRDHEYLVKFYTRQWLDGFSDELGTISPLTFNYDSITSSLQINDKTFSTLQLSATNFERRIFVQPKRPHARYHTIVDGEVNGTIHFRNGHGQYYIKSKKDAEEYEIWEDVGSEPKYGPAEHNELSKRLYEIISDASGSEDNYRLNGRIYRGNGWSELQIRLDQGRDNITYAEGSVRRDVYEDAPNEKWEYENIYGKRLELVGDLSFNRDVLYGGVKVGTGFNFEERINYGNHTVVLVSDPSGGALCPGSFYLLTIYVEGDIRKDNVGGCSDIYKWWVESGDFYFLTPNFRGEGHSLEKYRNGSLTTINPDEYFERRAHLLR